MEDTDGRCWDEYYADLLSNELIETNESVDSELIIELVNNNDSTSNIDNLNFRNIIVKLTGYSINYELKNWPFDNRIGIRVQPDEYLINIINLNNENNLDISLEKTYLKAGEKRKIKIGITKQTFCVSYSIKKKILRSEYRKRKKNSQD